MNVMKIVRLSLGLQIYNDIFFTDLFTNFIFSNRLNLIVLGLFSRSKIVLITSRSDQEARLFLIFRDLATRIRMANIQRCHAMNDAVDGIVERITVSQKMAKFMVQFAYDFCYVRDHLFFGVGAKGYLVFYRRLVDPNADLLFRIDFDHVTGNSHGSIG